MWHKLKPQVLVSPFMPATANRIRRQLGLDESSDDQGLNTIEQWGGLPAGLAIGKAEPIFPRVDTKKRDAPAETSMLQGAKAEDVNLISTDEF